MSQDNLLAIVNLDGMTIVALVTLVVTPLAIWVYMYYKKKYNYWAKRGIRGPKPTIVFGNLFQSVLGGSFVHSRWVHEHGKVYGFYVRTLRFLAVADTECIKDIVIRNFHCFTDRPQVANHPLELGSLINQNGAQWKHDRAIMSPTFSSGKMKAMFGLMRESYVHLENEFERLASLGVDVDTKLVFSKMTTMVIARCAFATEVNAFKDEHNILLHHLNSLFSTGFFRRITLIFMFLMPKAFRDFFSFTFIPKESLNYLGKVCGEIVKQRKSNPKATNEYPDLLQLLIDSGKSSNNNLDADSKAQVQQGLNDTKIIANAILFFIAGYETTSTLLFWASYALAMNPDVQEKLYEEAKEAKERSGDLDYETLFSMKYLDAFINETLRMYPPVVRFIRFCTQDHKLPNGLLVEKGTSIVVPVWAIHHDEENYPEPQKFDPERFMPENKDSINPATFLPFVQGPRNCIGMRFALLEAKMTLANLLLKYKFVKSPNTPEKLIFNERSFILAAKNMPLRVVKRQSN